MSGEPPVTVIRPDSGLGLDYWRRCWDHRELLIFLCRRDLVVKYRQTFAGLLWLLLRPAAHVAVFTILFGVLARFPSEGLPYPVLAMSGVVAWGFASAIVHQSAIALVNNQNLITKVSFPRLLLPLGTIAPNLIDLGINLAAFLALLAWFGHMPGWRIVCLPAAVGLLALNGLGLGLWFCAAAVRWRDFLQLSGLALSVLGLLSPVGFSSTVIRERLGETWSLAWYANPFAAAIDLFRWCVQPSGFAPGQDLPHLLISLASGLLLLWGGQRYFRRSERTFADVI